MPKQILLIDDDADDIELFREALALADSGAVLQYIDDSRELMNDAVTASIQTADLIFLDINMSLISGLDCLAFFKTNTLLNHIPVIMYSTSSHQKEITDCMEKGAAGFITKPSNFKELISILKKVLEK